MSIKISKDADPNYLAAIIKCPELTDHPNADRLQITNVFGGDVIVAKNMYEAGEKLVFFPVESCISTKFLSWANLLDKPELNADGKTKGFFSPKHGRTKAVKLRGVPSQGFLYKVSKIAEYYGVDESVFVVGKSFDTVGDDVLVKKYIRQESNRGGVNAPKKRIPKWVENTISVFPLPIRKKLYSGINYFYDKNREGIKSLIVDGHWHFHGKTEVLGRNIFTLNPDDEITISTKAHGTSAVFGNILCKKPFRVSRYLANNIGFETTEFEHRFVYSSRSVLKTRRDGKYTDDVWGAAASYLNGKIPENITVYGELVGWSSSNGNIQKGYDYGVPRGEFELWVYRATENVPDGVRELSWDEITKLCGNMGAKMVPLYYKGKASELFDIPIDDDWGVNFLKALKEKYLDKTCEICTTGVINEGIVLRNESKESKTALKYKSPLFLIKETSARDNGEQDMEEES